jgi:hypothetical protein
MLCAVFVLDGLTDSSSKESACKCIMLPILKLKIQSSDPRVFIPNVDLAAILYFFSF